MAKTVRQALDDLEVIYKEMAGLMKYREDIDIRKKIMTLREKADKIENIEINY